MAATYTLTARRNVTARCSADIYVTYLARNNANLATKSVRTNANTPDAFTGAQTFVSPV